VDPRINYLHFCNTMLENFIAAHHHGFDEGTETGRGSNRKRLVGKIEDLNGTLKLGGNKKGSKTSFRAKPQRAQR